MGERAPGDALMWILVCFLCVRFRGVGGMRCVLRVVGFIAGVFYFLWLDFRRIGWVGLACCVVGFICPRSHFIHGSCLLR